MRNKLAAALVACALAAAASADPGEAKLDMFPKAYEIFPRLLADPRHIQLSASYYRLAGQNTSDIALGHSWGMARWRTGADLSWLWEWDVEGMAYSRFKIGGGVNEFETVDFLGNLPVTLRKGDVAFKGALFHESSHLGDDYIRRTGRTGFRYSIDGLRAQASLEPLRPARLYAGAEYLLHTVPSLQRWGLQIGAEFMSDDLHWSKDVPTRVFLAEDLQWRQRANWGVDSRTVAGLKVGFRRSATRAMRFQVGYFAGRSPFGQFFSAPERYADVSFAFEL